MSMTQLRRKWKPFVENALRKIGLERPAKHVLGFTKSFVSYCFGSFAFWSPWDSWYRFLDKRFDWRFRVDTAGVVVLPEIHSNENFNGYSPTPHSLFRKLMRQLVIDHSRFTFIDFGCGKGKALLLASRLPFRRIIGIELSSTLVAIAKSNLETYRAKRSCKTIELIHGDVRDFPFPEEPTVCYFWDPFEAELMKKVLKNLRESLVESPREIYMLYFVPIHRRLFDEAPFLKLVKEDSWYCIYRAETASDGAPESM